MRMDYSLLGGAFSFGGKGVDFFFVLSGFIIFYVHYKDFSRSKRTSIYLKKRLIRVYPTYWLILLPVILFNFIFTSISSAGERTLGNIVQSILLIPQTHLPVLGVAWTLSHEMLFYLMFSLLIFSKSALGKLIFGSWIILSASWFIVQRLPGEVSTMIEINNYFIQFILSAHNLEFAMGIIAAYLLIKRKIEHKSFFLMSGISLFLLSAILDVSGLFKDKILSFGLSSFLILCGAPILDTYIKGTVGRFFVLLGDASYSMYLIHYPILVVGAIFGSKLSIHPVALTIVLLTLITTVSILFHLWVERPTLHLINNKFIQR